MNTGLSLIGSLAWSGHTVLLQTIAVCLTAIGLALRWSRKMSVKHKHDALTLDEKRLLHHPNDFGQFLKKIIIEYSRVMNWRLIN